MKKERQYSLTLFWRLLLGVTAAWLLLLSLTLGVTLRYSLSTFREHVDDILMSTVVTLGNAPSVRRSVENGACDPEFIDYLNDVVNNTSDLEYITIANADSIRIYHIDPAFIGLPFEGGDEDRVLAGEVYHSNADPENFERQRRAFHPVRSEEGEVIGFVMASATHGRLTELRAGIIETYVGIGLLLSFLTLLACAMLAIFLKRTVQGARTEDIIRIYLTQNDILNAMDEGLLSYDNTGKVRLANAAAARMLGQREDLLVGQQVDDLLRAEDGSSLRDRTDQELGQQTSRANVLAKNIRLPDSNLWARQVLILADKTEVMRYSEELVGTRHMLGTLRANNHDFVNKLQVISGLLQMGRVQEVQSYIGNLSATYEHILGPVMRLIHNTSVAALLLGKSVSMQELDIEMALMRNSTLPERSRYLSTTELVTVLGNLLENAMEATDAVPLEEPRTVSLQLTEDDQGLFIMVSDTGEGISPEVLPHMYEGGFSTKASRGRGIGLKRIKEIVDRRGGTIEVDTEPGSGTTFTLIFSRERGERV